MNKYALIIYFVI